MNEDYKELSEEILTKPDFEIDQPDHEMDDSHTLISALTEIRDGYQNNNHKLLLGISNLITIFDSYDTCFDENFLSFNTLEIMLSMFFSPSFTWELNTLEDEIMRQLMNLLEKMTNNKKDGFLFRFVELGFVDMFSEAAAEIDPHRFECSLRMLQREIAAYPKLIVENMKDESIECLIDRIHEQISPEVCKVIAWILFMASSNDSKGLQSQLMSYCNYMAGCGFQYLDDIIINTISNLVVSEKTALYFVLSESITNMINRALQGENLDSLSSVLCLLPILFTYYNDPQLPAPSYEYAGILHSLTVEEEEIVENALYCISEIIKVHPIGMHLIELGLFDALLPIADDQTGRAKVDIAVIFSVLASEYDIIEPLLENDMVSYADFLIRNNDEIYSIIGLKALVKAALYCDENGCLDTLGSELENHDLFEYLDDLRDDDEKLGISSRASLILHYFESGEEEG